MVKVIKSSDVRAAMVDRYQEQIPGILALVQAHLDKQEAILDELDIQLEDRRLRRDQYKQRDV